MMANVIYNLTMSSSDGSLNRDIVTLTVILFLNVYLAVTIIIINLLFPSDIKTVKVTEKKTYTGRHRSWYLVLPQFYNF